MKKLLTFVSAITAGAIGTAAADVSVAGSGSFYYSSGSGSTAVTENENSMTVTGGTVTFAMSTETTNGITVTAGATISRDTDDIAEYTAAAAAGDQGIVGGMKNLTLGMDGMTVTLGQVDGVGSGTGEGGDVATFASTHAGAYAGTANHAHGTSYGVFNNSADMALNLGFTGYRRGSYDFYKTDWKYLNDWSTRGGFGDIEGALVPAGTSTVYDQQLGQNIKRPFLHIRYRASETENRKNKSWITGSVGTGAPTTDIDEMRIAYLSERCLITQAANNFVLFKA